MSQARPKEKLVLRIVTYLHLLWARLPRPVLTWPRLRLMGAVGGQKGQSTAEYALVMLAAATIALVLLTWARSSGKLPAFFDRIIDRIMGSAE